MTGICQLQVLEHERIDVFLILSSASGFDRAKSRIMHSLHSLATILQLAIYRILGQSHVVIHVVMLGHGGGGGFLKIPVDCNQTTRRSSVQSACY